VLCFLATKNAGSTKPGKPYQAKFSDSVGNVCVRDVVRPAIIADYFSDSNIIDSHNHVRQGELKLEKHWVTKDCWFRLDTTLIGMTVTDAWKALTHGTADKKLQSLSIIQFADRIAYDCINNKRPNDAPTSLALHLEIADDTNHPSTVVVDSAAPQISPVSVASTLEDLSVTHPRIDNPERQDSGRPRRRTCRVPGC
jgi:hypothetical protein